MAKRSWCGLALILFVGTASGQTGGCNARAASPSVTVSLPAAPFGVVPSQDGCWVFVSLMGRASGEHPGIAVLKRANGRVTLSHVAHLSSRPTGIALTHDGKMLIAAALDEVIFLDVEKLTTDSDHPALGSMPQGSGAGSIYTNVSADDKLLFVSQERERAITVIDLERARHNGFRKDSIIGAIPTCNAPIALTVSPDGKYLYTTCQGATPEWKWPKACTAEGGRSTAITRPEGAVVVVDMARARTDPANAAVARIPAGCSPVRLAISPEGSRVYVTARNSNAVVAFDAAKLPSDGEHARIGTAPVGTAPVPIAVVDGGRKLVAGNSNRFAGSKAGESLTVLDASQIPRGSGAVLGSIPAGAFPRELTVSADGGTLFLTNFGSNSLQVMDVQHLPLQTDRRQ